MGFFSDLFGGTDRSAQKGQTRANADSQDFIEKQSELARSDFLRLFPQADEATRQGTQGALDVLGQTIPQQFRAFEQGNMNAQNQIASGMRGSRAALMGLPVYETFSPQPFNIDTSFAQQQLAPSSFGQSPLAGAQMQGAQPQGAPTGMQGLQGLSPDLIRLIMQEGNF
jgi:hypothetical protein